MNQPQPIFLNVEHLFYLLTRFLNGIFSIEFLERLRVIAIVLIIFLIAAILYYLVVLYERKQAGSHGVKPIAVPVSGGESGTVAAPVPTLVRNEIWEGIRAKLLSDNQSDWRLAIIEADIYLDRLLDANGFHGDTTSDKLKQITPAELASIQIAWEAHKVRNRIAHDGAAFALSQPEVRRILSYFEIVFRDLGAIS